MTKGALNLYVRTFNEVAPGKTHVEFEMEHETGMNAAVSGTVKIDSLSDHVRDQASKGLGPAAPNP